MKLKNVEKLVENAIVDYPETRKDDFLLVYRVYEQLHPHIQYVKFGNISNKHTEYKLPSYASITRARRKIFSKFPELRNEKMTSIRIKEQEKYLEYNEEK